MKSNDAMLSPHDRFHIEKASAEVFPRVLPSDWRQLGTFANARDWMAGEVRVLAEVEMVDGALWLHVSMSRRGRLPSWEDLREIKNVVIGRDRKAIQVLPRESEYVNIHPYVLHLYAPLETDPVPDFRMIQNDGVVGI